MSRALWRFYLWRLDRQLRRARRTQAELRALVLQAYKPTLLALERDLRP